MIHVPTVDARPGDIVTVRIERTSRPADPSSADDHQPVSLTLASATTPQERDAVIEKWRAIGRRNRAQLTDEQLADLNNDWLYDENGLPK